MNNILHQLGITTHDISIHPTKFNKEKHHEKISKIFELFPNGSRIDYNNGDKNSSGMMGDMMLWIKSPNNRTFEKLVKLNEILKIVNISGLRGGGIAVDLDGISIYDYYYTSEGILKK